MKKEILKPFVVISSPDGMKFWIPQRRSGGQVICTAGFDLPLSLVDAVDALDYAAVESVERVDKDLSHLTITLPGDDALSRLCEDMPVLIDHYVPHETAKKVDQSQVPA